MKTHPRFSRPAQTQAANINDATATSTRVRTPLSTPTPLASEFERVGFQIETLRPPGGLRIGVVRSLFRSALTERMLDVVEKRAQRFGVRITAVCLARGALETPFLAQALLKRKNIDGIVVLAAVIKGQTQHDDVVVREATRALVQLGLHHQKPVGIGIIGPGVTLEQAHDRVPEYAQGALDAVVLSSRPMVGKTRK